MRSCCSGQTVAVFMAAFFTAAGANSLTLDLNKKHQQMTLILLTFLFFFIGKSTITDFYADRIPLSVKHCATHFT